MENMPDSAGAVRSDKEGCLFPFSGSGPRFPGLLGGGKPYREAPDAGGIPGRQAQKILYNQPHNLQS